MSLIEQPLQEQVRKDDVKPFGVSIIGSCVSRDPFELEPKLFQIKSYVARTSFASIIGEEFGMNIQTHNILSKWQRDIVETDLYKRGMDRTVESKPDVLVIDFIDERFHLLNFHGTVATFSLHLSELLGANAAPALLIRNGSKEYRELWLAGWKKFVEIIEKRGLEDKCVLHKTWWAEHDSNSVPFRPELVKAGNKNLEWCYENALAVFPKIKVIAPPSEILIADASHKWGRAPYHYCEAEQRYLLEELQKFRNNKQQN